MPKKATGKFDLYRTTLILIPCLFFLPELLRLSYFAGWDITRLNLPLKWYDVQSIRDGALPLWNHYMYTGMPQLAESESGLFYPGNILLHLPGDFFYWASITYILHFVLAGLCMDLWLRGRGISPLVSFFGAVLYQTAPFLVFHITSMALLQSIIWFPLLLWLADRYFDCGDSRKRLFISGWLFVFGGMLVFVGSAQMAFYQGFLLFWYLVGKILADWKLARVRTLKLLGILGSLLLGAILIGAIIWIPAMEFAKTTVREGSTKAFYYLGSNWLDPLKLSSMFFFPAYAKQTEVVGWASSLIYIGLLPTLLALLRLFGIRANWKKEAPLIVMGTVALFLAFGMKNPVNHILIKLPVFDMFRYQGRFALGVIAALIPLGCSWLSGQLDHVEVIPVQVTSVRIKWVIGIVFLMFLAFISTTSRATTVLIGAVILLIDIALSWYAISMIRKSSMMKVPIWMVLYVVFHLVIVFPVGRLATMKAGKFREAMTFFDQIKREDGMPPRLLTAGQGKFADLDLLKFDHWTPQDYLPNLVAGNTGVFHEVQVMNPYTPLRPKEWDTIIRGTIVKEFDAVNSEFKETGVAGTISDETAGLLETLGVDAVLTSYGIKEIPGFHHVAMDDNLSGLGKLFRADVEQPRESFEYEYNMNGYQFGKNVTLIGLIIALILIFGGCQRNSRKCPLPLLLP